MTIGFAPLQILNTFCEPSIPAVTKKTKKRRSSQIKKSKLNHNNMIVNRLMRADKSNNSKDSSLKQSVIQDHLLISTQEYIDQIRRTYKKRSLNQAQDLMIHASKYAHHIIDCLDLIELNQEYKIQPHSFTRKMLQKALMVSHHANDLLFLLPMALHEMPKALLSTCQRIESNHNNVHHLLTLSRIYFDLQPYVKYNCSSYIQSNMARALRQAKTINDHIAICETYTHLGYRKKSVRFLRRFLTSMNSWRQNELHALEVLYSLAPKEAQSLVKNQMIQHNSPMIQHSISMIDRFTVSAALFLTSQQHKHIEYIHKTLSLSHQFKYSLNQISPYSLEQSAAPLQVELKDLLKMIHCIDD
jgi:hypothetical protein